MIFNGFQKTDLVNFPSNIAATVFVRGCNFCCPYCHNVTLVNPQEYTEESYPEEEVLEYLDLRKNFLDGLVVSGGEPTLYSELPSFIRKVKAKGLLVKLDTNGSNPEMLESLLSEGLLDYVAMDIKAPFEKYRLFSKEDDALLVDNIKRTMEILRNGNVKYEFRTTCPKSLLSKDDFSAIAAMLKPDEIWFLQEFNPKVTLNPSYCDEVSYSPDELREIASLYEMAVLR